MNEAPSPTDEADASTDARDALKPERVMQRMLRPSLETAFRQLLVVLVVMALAAAAIPSLLPKG